jgi:hypothetical protein
MAVHLISIEKYPNFCIVSALVLDANGSKQILLLDADESKLTLRALPMHKPS